MAYNFTPFKNKTKAIEEKLRFDYRGVRTGRSSSLLLEKIMVNAHNTRLPFKELGSVVIEDAKTLRVSPWDKSQIKAMETAIASANLGVSVVADRDGLRVIFPELTADSRQKLIKIVRAEFEQARIALRQARDLVWHEIQINERTGKISEDEKFRSKNELEKIMDQSHKILGQLAEKKEKEILT